MQLAAPAGKTLAVERRDYEEAVRCEQQSVRVSEGLARRHELALFGLAEMQVFAGRPADATGFMERAASSPIVQTMPSTLIEFGRVDIVYLVRLGRVKDALAEGRATLAAPAARLGRDQPEVTTTADALAEATRAAGLWQETVELTDR